MRPICLKPCVLAVVLAVVLVTAPEPCHAEQAMGVQLPARAKRLKDGRYRIGGRSSPEAVVARYRKTVTHFNKVLKRAKIPYEASQRVYKGHVKYMHFRSLDVATQWQHINVSAYDGHVYVMLLARKPGTR
jgi:hypothetical protein